MLLAGGLGVYLCHVALGVRAPRLRRLLGVRSERGTGGPLPGLSLVPLGMGPKGLNLSVIAGSMVAPVGCPCGGALFLGGIAGGSSEVCGQDCAVWRV